MRLIKDIEIKGFRSIRGALIEGNKGFTIFAGLNNSGKSNVLRALNAFFTGETDPGIKLDVDEDYYKPDISKRKKKSISVSITFALPAHFRLSKAIKGLETMLGGRVVKIKKEWTRGKITADYFLNEERNPLNFEDQQKIEQFLNLITFRYVPNRVLPTELIKNEHKSLRDVLIRRLGNKYGGEKEVFAAVQEISERLIKSFSKRFEDTVKDADYIRLSTPTSWADMIFAFGYKIGVGDYEVDDIAQGSGIQSILMFETLYLIDKDYFQKFGWRQAAIWAIEEPESSLHYDLCLRLGDFFKTVTSLNNNRLQIFATTHSEAIIQYSLKPIITFKEGPETQFEFPANTKTAIENTASHGISSWVHPVLHYPNEPLIILPGKYDYDFFLRAFEIIDLNTEYRLTYLELLDKTAGKTGGDEVYRYIKNHLIPIKLRLPSAPIKVVLDWDDKGKTGQFQKLFKSEEQTPFGVFAMLEEEANPNVGKSFKGIERFYSDRLINLAINNGASIGKTNDGKFIAEKDSYGETKKTLNELVKRGISEADVKYVTAFIGLITS